MKKRKAKKRRDDLIAWISLGLLVICGIVGFNHSKTDLTQFKDELWPTATTFETVDYELLLTKDGDSSTLGSISSGTYNGFGGPLKVAVAVDVEGTIKNMAIVEHRETPSWYDRVMEQDFLQRLKGKSYKEPILLGRDIDGITGATYTVKAITEATREATLKSAKDAYGYDIDPYLTPRKIKFGLPEISLMGLMLIAVIGAYKVPKRHQKTMRWILMILGATLIGFVFNQPLTLTDVNKLIMGYWPDIYNQLYWYMLIFGIVIIFLTTGKNTYCRYICPFGAVQECVGAISGAKNVHSKTFNKVFNWTRRIVVLVTIMIALVYRNPGMSSYEVYGTIFNLLGTNFEVFFLAMILGFALFIKRPWCNYLCPIPVIEHYARFVHKKLETSFKRMVRNQHKTAQKTG
ncbi:FMN-binding protein [Muricauda sp. SCSIO 64092]|uniref:FMN-binding protein n=1 Tax=Allomuricauda sp. SCSIO 64092 TaxID=2908842 RepID=UPI001FF20925|nr:FMN-binding protein [Muricauda sp. SCSIO 64092]UOY08287.1 FMN-binding protein [Muricauda sp. SCSIO 64092]